MSAGKRRGASYVTAMDEEEFIGVQQVATGLWVRILDDGEQPTDEIARFAEQTFMSATAAIGERRWHESMLDALVRALNTHRETRRVSPNSIFMLTVALHDIVLLATPMDAVREDLREPADSSRVEMLLAEIRSWRQLP